MKICKTVSWSINRLMAVVTVLYLSWDRPMLTSLANLVHTQHAQSWDRAMLTSLANLVHTQHAHGTAVKARLGSIALTMVSGSGQTCINFPC